MQAYSLIKYSDNYLKTSGSLQQYCGDEPNNNVTDYELFKFKSKLLDNTNNEGIINAKMAVSLKYLSNFWVTLEIINCEINFILTQIANFIISQRDSNNFCNDGHRTLCSDFKFVNSRQYKITARNEIGFEKNN